MGATRGTLTCMLANYERLVKTLDNIAGVDAEKVIKKCTADAKSRAGGWVSAVVRQVYNISPSDMKSALEGKGRGNGQLKIEGNLVESVVLTYKGRVLTPTHFKMQPKERSPKPYRVSQAVFKGQRKKLPAGVFLASSGGEDSTQIPFQRESSERYPIKSIKTLSVPQMIENEKVQPLIQEKIDEGLSKRLEHNVNRMLEKAKA